MIHRVLICTLILVLTLAGCGTVDTKNQSGETSDTDSEMQETSDKESEEPSDTGSGTEKTPDKATEVSMKNIALGIVPDGYYSVATRQGKLENFTYDTKDYIGNGSAIKSSATVYLPYGYDQDDYETRYNILYLQHGAYGNERTWMYGYGDSFKNMIDHMIEDKLIPPLIIVMPYLPSGNEWYHDTTPIFYSGELKNDLMPAVEAHYHTYAENTSDAGFEASRSHRAFGGFSAGVSFWREWTDSSIFFR